MIFAISYWRFLRYLPSRIQFLFCLAAILYVGGATGVESLGAIYWEMHDLQNEGDLTYNMIATVEETLEMAGTLVFIHALFLYISSIQPELRIRITPSGRPGRDPEDRGTLEVVE
ncbi:MAG: hypothetical protein ACREQV_02295 [Candidatus Binatia bacterium]